MARRRKPSDDVYNARRRVRRLADRLERQGRTEQAASLRDAARTGSGVTTGELDAIYNQSQTARSATRAQQQHVAQATQRPPRAKKPSDEVYNARRRLMRQAASLERQAASSPDAIAEQMRSFAASLRNAAEQAKGKMTQQARQEALERLARIREYTRDASYGMSSVYRRNLITMQQLNAAGTKDADSRISETEKNLFWMAVKGLWPEGSDVPRNERYNKIIDHFYFSDNSDSKDFKAWLERKGRNISEVAGDLSLVFEWITTELNDPTMRDSPEVPYDELKKIVLTLR